jgi:hypothetical protein
MHELEYEYKYEFEPHGEMKFYEWLNDVLAICNDYSLAAKAGIKSSDIENHRQDIRLLRLYGNPLSKHKKLKQEYFARIARAVMKSTHGTIVISWDTFQLDSEGRICIHTANRKGQTVLHPLTDEQFNELF